MKKFILVLLSVFALSLITQAQVLNTVTLGTNTMAVSTTNTAASSAIFVGGQKQCTVFFAVAPASNTVAIPAGTGSSTFTLAGSPDAAGGTFYTLNTNSTVTLTYNGTNQVNGYLVVDTSSFQQLQIVSMSNTATNLVWTNCTVKYLLK